MFLIARKRVEVCVNNHHAGVQNIGSVPKGLTKAKIGNSRHISGHVSDLGTRERRRILKTRMDLSQCPYMIDSEGMIQTRSFVRHDIVEKAFGYSGKFFLASLGTCNDAKMEYEMTCKPLVRVDDKELAEVIDTLVENKFAGRKISGITQSEKCSIIKNIYFNNKTTIPQLSRILGLPKAIIRQILST